MSESPAPALRIAKKEAALFSILLFVGLVLLPGLVWVVGQAVFGAYGGDGYGEFFGTLMRKIRSGDWVAWFLVLSPWLGVQLLRLATRLWRLAAKL